MNKKGFTLIELIITIIVGGIFIPFAYVVFTSVVKNSMKPETAAILRTIAETKINDINNMSYDSVVSSGYTSVTSDPRFSDAQFPSPPLPASPIPNPYSGYQWRWEVSAVTYFTDVSDLKLGTPMRIWQPSQVYAVGEYIKKNNLFYRVYFPKWQANTPYRIGNNIIPTATNGHVYRLELNYPTWTPNTSFASSDSIFPTTYNEFFYKVLLPAWKSNTSYALDNKAASPNGVFAYQCWFCLGGPCVSGNDGSHFDSGDAFVSDNTLSWVKFNLQSGATQPIWPIMDGTFVNDNLIIWQAYSMKSGATEPLWLTATSSITPDKNLLWREDTSMRSGITEPTWPTAAGGLVDDNTIKWIESTVYKQVKAYVLPPGCSSGQPCEYVFTFVATEKNYTNRP